MQNAECSPTVKRVINELLSVINSRKSKLEDNKSLQLAAFLDPRFKLPPFVNERPSKLKNTVQSYYLTSGRSNKIERVLADHSSNQGEFSNDCAEQPAKFNV